MDYKEKYEEALERARALNSGKDIDVEAGTTICEYIFPELKESDDERIRKELIEAIKGLSDTGELSMPLTFLKRKNAWIAWLEKQGEKQSLSVNERAWLYLVSDVLTWKDGIGQYLDNPRVQKLAKKLCSEYAQKLYTFPISSDSDIENNKQEPNDRVEPKFHEGDWVINKLGDVWQIDSFDKKNYQVSDGKGNHNYFPISKQNEMRLWTIEDAKIGDVLVHYDSTFIFMGVKNGIVQALEENLVDGTNPVCFGEYDKDGNYYPATKEQRDLLFQKMEEAGYEWDAEKKKIEKKQK